MQALDEPNRSAGTIKIAVPMAGGRFSEHFGGAREFLIFEADSRESTPGPGELFRAPEHKPGSLPEWLAGRRVDMVIASAIGERALIMLADAGIETYLAVGNPEPSVLATACLSGKLPRANPGNSRCNGDHHDHDTTHP